MRRFFDRTVAVSAIQSDLGCVSLMRKRDRLERLVTGAGVFGREIIRKPGGDTRNEKKAPDKEVAWQPIDPFWKNVRH